MKLYRNQLGALNPLVIVLIVVVLGAVGFAGWKVYDNNKSSDSSSSTAPVELSKSEQKAIKEECKKLYNDDDFCKFASNWTLDGKYEAIMTTKDVDGSTAVIAMKVDGDNTSTITSQNGAENGAYISLNGDSYYKDYDANVWYKMPKTTDDTTTTPETEISGDFEFDFEDEAKQGEVSVKFIAKEACGDKTCFKYQYIDTTDTETGEMFIWFDDKDYKLVRMQATNSDGSTIDSVFTYPDNISITEPSPVQDMPQFDPSSLGL